MHLLLMYVKDPVMFANITTESSFHSRSYFSKCHLELCKVGRPQRTSTKNRSTGYMLVGYLLCVAAYFNSSASVDTQHTVLDTSL